MENLLKLFTAADTYYQYAEGNAYTTGRQSVEDFRTEYEKLSKEDKIKFYHLVKDEHPYRVDYFKILKDE